MKLRKLIALLLTLAMVLPMAASVVPVSAEDISVEEIPTATLVVQDSSEEDASSIQQWNFTDETELEDFDLYASGDSSFVVQDGVLQSNGASGEQKAILKEEISNVKTVSVNILPNDEGTIYGGVLIGASDAADGVDQVNALTVLVRSDYTGWPDAPNRVDLIIGEFNYGWTMHDYLITESQFNNNLFSGGNKEPLHLEIAIGYDSLLITLSLVSNPSKFVQRLFQTSHDKLQGKVGLRSHGSATKYDRFTINEDYLPESLTQGLEFDGSGLTSYAKTGVGMSEKPVTIEAWFKMEDMENGSRRQCIISNYTGNGLASNSAGTWGLYTNENGTLYYTEISSTGLFNQTLGVDLWTGEWMHIALVRSSGVLCVYINGDLIKSVENAAIGESASLTNSLTFGYCTVGGGTGINAMNGAIGDIRLWSKERTQQQIQDSMYDDLTNTEEGLIHHWDFDEQYGSGVIDYVGNMPATVIGAQWSSPREDTGVFTGVKLDGTSTDSYVKSLETVSQKPVTIEAWVNMDKLADGDRRQAIISNYTGNGLAANSAGTWGLYTDEGGRLYYTELTSEGNFNQTLGTKVWHGGWVHIALVRGDGMLEVYINGSLINSISHTAIGNTECLDNYLTIGYCTIGGGTGINSLQGMIGDIRLWSTERTAQQIKENMYADMTGAEEGLTNHWNFDSHSYGVISNSVDGATDCALLGHTQIGDQEIRRWDFSDESQLEDFTVYASPGTKITSNFVISDGTLNAVDNVTDGGGWGSEDLKAILNEQIDNIQSISVDLHAVDNWRTMGGFYLGVKDINSTEAFDLDAVAVFMGGWRTSSARMPWGEIEFREYSYKIKLNSLNKCNQKFYSTTPKESVHLQAEFDGDTVNALMYHLNDPTITVQSAYTGSAELWEGKIGLMNYYCNLKYDNFTVVYGQEEQQTIEPEQPSVEESTTLYDNQGYSFLSETYTWKMSKELSQTPYTVEAWVKIPEAVSDGASGYIVTNATRAPYISMQMTAGGGLRLSRGVEDEGLSIVNTEYDVDVDLRNGKWTHIAYTCDVANDTVVAYINGQSVKTWEDANLVDFALPDHISPDNLMSIGSLGSINVYLNDEIASNALVGWVADVRMWDKPLSAEEIQNSMLTQYTQAHDGLIVNLPLSEKADDTFTDLSGNGYDVTQYSNKITLEEQTHESGAYSVVIIPDQQILSHFYEDKLNAMYQWIADNRETENIQFVMSVGDLVDNCGNVDQWTRTRAAVDLLPDGLPFLAVPGNHDYDTNSGWDQGYGVRDQLTLMNEYLPQSLFESYPTQIGFFDDVNSANQWQTFSVNGNHYLVIGLEYIPQDDVLAWANQVVAAHPYHQVILVTHSYVGSYGELDVPKVWSEFVSKHENIIMAFSGHVAHGHVVHRTETGVNGNQVHNILMDAQFTDATNGGYAMVGLLRFNADGTVCDISYYSTDKAMYDIGSNFTLSIAEPAQIPAQVNGTLYPTVADAIAAADGAVVEILQSTDEEITITSDLTIDLAGYSLSNVTVSEGAKLTLVDSTSTYDVCGGSAAVTGDVEMLTELDGKKYMVIGEDGVYSAHRYYAGLTHTTLNTANTGFGYKAQYKGDEVVQSQVATMGYELWIDGGRVVTRSLNGFKDSLTLLLKNIDVDKHGETVVYARIFMTLTNGETVYGATHSSSMRQMVEDINEGYADFSAEKLQALAAMINQNETMQGWEVANILAAQENSEDSAA